MKSSIKVTTITMTKHGHFLVKFDLGQEIIMASHGMIYSYMVIKNIPLNVLNMLIAMNKVIITAPAGLIVPHHAGDFYDNDTEVREYMSDGFHIDGDVNDIKIIDECKCCHRPL